MNTHSLAVMAAGAPERLALSQRQHDIIFYAIVVAGLALFASFVRSWNTKTEVSARYRPAIIGSLCITGVATLSYLVLAVKFDSGYVLDGGRYVPNSEALFSIAPRYMDWTVSVPLLVIELLAVSTLAGRKLSTVRASGVAAAFLMIVTGYLGTQVFDLGTSTFWLWLWWAISMVFFIYLYVALVPAIAASVKQMSPQAGRAYGSAGTLLLTTFLVYPIVYLIPVFFAGGWWTTAIQVAFSSADVVAKVGFGMMIHKVAKIRTAEDVLAGEETHPEPIWINNEHLSNGLMPPLAESNGLVHAGRRARVDGNDGTDGRDDADRDSGRRVAVPRQPGASEATRAPR